MKRFEMEENSKEITIYEFDKVCRTCLGEGELKPLYENCSKDVCLIEMLMSCTFVQFRENDGLPVQICGNCVEEINKSYNFAKKCQDADTELRKCINSFQSKLRQTKRMEKFKNAAETIQVESTGDAEDAIKAEEVEANVVETLKDDINETIEELYVKNEDYSDTDEEPVKKTIKKLKLQPPYLCKRCGATFPHFELLKLHRQEVKHPPIRKTRKICNICSKSVSYSRMNQHMRTHTLEKPYVCELCGARFSVSSNLRRHTISRHSDKKPYQCDECTKGFTRLSMLKDHKRIHTGEKPFVCNYCGKAFTQSSSLKTHLWSHNRKDNPDGDSDQPIRSYTCLECNRCFSTKPLLRAHMLIHGEKRFLCSDCGRSFISMILLKSHSKVHTGIKPYKCSVCTKTFSHYGSLKSHNLTHTGERPHTCNVCNRTFTQRGHLKYHMRTHSGERPYVCSVCGKTFALNGNLTVHMRTHTGETPYVCPVCGKGFHDSSSMKKHQKGHGASA